MAQLDLFGRSRMNPVVPQKPDLQKIRLLLGAALQELRAAKEMPWEASRLRSWHHVFQNMTKWLPPEERDEICRDFETQIARLQHPLPIFWAKAG